MLIESGEMGDVVGDLLAKHRAERRRFDVIADYMANREVGIYVPRSANAEYRELVAQAKWNVLRSVVRSLAQNLYVDGHRPMADSGRPEADNSPLWDAVWQANRMDARQAALWRPAITYGWSYAVVLPGRSAPVITPVGPRTLTALWDDDVNDEWPQAAMVVRRPLSRDQAVWSDPLVSATIDDGARISVYDDHFRYELVHKGGAWLLHAEAAEHGLGVVPVVRFLDEVSDELPTGKVWPLLPVQRQLNQTTFNLLMAGQYAAFRQRWVTGMAIAEGPDGAPVEPWNAAVNRVWQSESPDTRFGDFDQTDLGGYLAARDKAMLFVAADAQIPPHNLIIGPGVSNISAEALAALEAGHRQDIAEHQTSFGESVEQMFRLAALAMGDRDGWEDMSAQVVWRDTTPRSLAQVADALGKLATQLGIPPQALWERVPGVTDQDIARWQAMASDGDLLGALSSMLAEDDTTQGEGSGGAVTGGQAPDAAASA